MSIMRKRLIVFLCMFLSAVLTGCGKEHRHLSMEEAMKMMQSETDVLVVDVRTKEEFDKRHIPGAVLVPIEEIRAGRTDHLLPDKQKTLLLYCWTGRRAEDAAALLVDMGYWKVYEFGGLV